MLDESEGPVAPHERHLAFNNKSVWARIAIVIAGPLFNFIFAFIALWLVLIIGIKSFAPIIGEVKPDSIAAQAGLTAQQEILSLDHMPIASWHDFQYALMPLLGSHEEVAITVKSLNNNQEKTFTLPLATWHMDSKKPDALKSLGLVPFIPTIPPIVGEVMPESPAALGGLKPKDKIISVNGQAINDWLALVDFIKDHPDAAMKLKILREGKSRDMMVHTGSESKDGQTHGLLGVRSQQIAWPDNWLRLQRENPLKAAHIAFNQTVLLSGATFSLIGRLLTGKLSLQSISGPVGIAQGAGESGRSGLPYYLSFLALVSISLGVLNLLPIPMLDGGHLLYFLIELITRRPLSEKLKATGVYVGLLLLILLMVIALHNDLSRL